MRLVRVLSYVAAAFAGAWLALELVDRLLGGDGVDVGLRTGGAAEGAPDELRRGMALGREWLESHGVHEVDEPGGGWER